MSYANVQDDGVVTPTCMNPIYYMAQKPDTGWMSTLGKTLILKHVAFHKYQILVNDGKHIKKSPYHPDFISKFNLNKMGYTLIPITEEEAFLEIL